MPGEVLWVHITYDRTKELPAGAGCHSVQVGTCRHLIHLTTKPKRLLFPPLKAISLVQKWPHGPMKVIEIWNVRHWSFMMGSAWPVHESMNGKRPPPFGKRNWSGR